MHKLDILLGLGRTSSAPLSLDLSILLETRMLIQANSRGGKSYLMRLIVERAAGKIPFIILDWEGEFITLREKADVVLVGNDGEIATDVRAAKLLARKLIELHALAVIDLSDLEPDERRKYAGTFLDALINLPRTLWNPAIICVDEAHQFCPEKGKEASSKAVINLMSLGGKRSFCGILATQRLSKLHKDAANECNNVFIGRTWMDVDQNRAIDNLGIGKQGRQMLRDLNQGEFFAFGPALSIKGVNQFQADLPVTKPPKVGERRSLIVPKASDVVSHIVSQLADLPEEAEREIRDLEEAKKRIVELERGVTSKVVKLDQRVGAAAVQAGAQNAEKRLKGAEAGHQRELDDLERQAKKQYEKMVGIYEKALADLRGRLQKIAGIASVDQTVELPPPTMERKRIAPVPEPREMPRAAFTSEKAIPKQITQGISKSQQQILDALAWFESVGIQSPSRSNVAAMAGVSPRSSGFRANVSTLSGKSLVRYPMSDCLALTEEGRSAANKPDAPLTLGELHEGWMRSRALSSPQKSILSILLKAYPDSLTREELAEAANVSVLSSGFRANVSTLSGFDLVIYPDSGRVQANRELLFPEGLS